MTIIQEKPSTNGMLLFTTLEGVAEYWKADKQIVKKNPGRHNLIWVRLSNEAKYPICHFPSVERRNECYSFIANSKEDIVVLDYNRFFSESKVADVQAFQYLGTSDLSLRTYLHSVFMYQNWDLPHLRTLDAFIGLPDVFLQMWYANQYIYVYKELADKLVPLWAKCLYVPKQYRGITPVQFFRYLIKKNNETCKLLGITDTGTS